MPHPLRFYMDESGPRQPERVPLASYPQRAFAMGGILVADEDKATLATRHAEFCARWNITYPLRSHDIRQRNGNFGWLASDIARRHQFLAELTAFICGLPILTLACVIDRCGYDRRYRPKYEHRNMWWMCRTAFCIAIERACKFAMREGRRLRVYPEGADPEANAKVRGYYEELRETGMPFDMATSATYTPLTPKAFAGTLCEFDLKTKKSAGAQIADLCLWPVVQNGYEPYGPYSYLEASGRLIECRLAQNDRERLGSKYSCFEGVKRGT